MDGFGGGQGQEEEIFFLPLLPSRAQGQGAAKGAVGEVLGQFALHQLAPFSTPEPGQGFFPVDFLAQVPNQVIAAGGQVQKTGVAGLVLWVEGKVGFLPKHALVPAENCQALIPYVENAVQAHGAQCPRVATAS